MPLGKPNPLAIRGSGTSCSPPEFATSTSWLPPSCLLSGKGENEHHESWREPAEERSCEARGSSREKMPAVTARSLISFALKCLC